MAEPDDLILNRVNERVEVLLRELHEIIEQPRATALDSLAAGFSVHSRALLALMDATRLLAAEIDPLRHQSAPRR